MTLEAPLPAVLCEFLEALSKNECQDYGQKI